MFPILALRRYDTIKTCRWNFFKFPWVVYYRKICKNEAWKTGDHQTIFSVLEVRRSKILETLNKTDCFLNERDCFCLHSWFLFFSFFFWRFSRKNWLRQWVYDLTLCLAHFVNKVINFRSLCEKMSWMCTYFKTETAVAQNLIDDFFLYFWLSDNLSIRRILSEKNMGVRG